MSTDEYVPDEWDLRDAWRTERDRDEVNATEAGAEFDRFLARVRRDAAREALDGQGAALDLLEVIKDRDQRIERVRGLMNHNDNIDNVPIDDLLRALDGDA